MSNIALQPTLMSVTGRAQDLIRIPLKINCRPIWALRAEISTN